MVLIKPLAIRTMERRDCMGSHKRVERIKELDRQRRRREKRLKLRKKGLPGSTTTPAGKKTQ
jgi:hypothetical protein